MIGITHLIFALSISSLVNLSVSFLAIGSIFPDIDILFQDFGLFHRNSTFHTPIFLLFLSLIIFAVFDSKSAISFSVGWFSHLLLDTFNLVGIHWFFPIIHPISLGFSESGNLIGNFLIILSSIGIVLISRVIKWKKIF